MNLSSRTLFVNVSALIILVVAVVFGKAVALQETGRENRIRAQGTLPDKDYDHPPKEPHSSIDYIFKLDQLEHFYRTPGEFGHRLRGSNYGFESLSFIITETLPGGGPNLHKHDVEEAHVLLEGSAQYLIGDKMFTAQGPYIAKVPAGVPHSFLNVGTEPFKLVAVFASNRHSSKRLGPNPLVRTAPSK